MFHGGFTPEAASHVVRLDPEPDERAVGDVLSVLLHKSLIHAERAENGVRYTLCEGIRAEAAEMLERGAEASGTRSISSIEPRAGSPTFRSHRCRRGRAKNSPPIARTWRQCSISARRRGVRIW